MSQSTRERLVNPHGKFKAADLLTPLMAYTMRSSWVTVQHPPLL